MSRRVEWLLAVLGLLLLLGLGLWSGLLGQLHSYTEIVERGPSVQARTDPYLAAQTFMRQQGLAVTRANSLQVLDQLDPRGASLMLLGDRTRMSPQQADRLLRWVWAGGRLLFVAQALWNDDNGMSGDLLLDRLQLHQLLSKDLPKPAPASEAEDIVQYPTLTRLYLENEKAPAYFSFNPAYHLEDPTNQASAWANSADSTHLMQLGWGAGLVTVITDGDLWRNSAIGQFDNAWLLWYLNQGSHVTLLGEVAQDGWPTLLWRNFAQALVALAALLIAGAWHFAVRQGPLQAPLPLARRQLSEHLSASADFLLHQNGQAPLLRALQNDILRRARRRHPGFERLAIAEQWQVLARLSQQPTAAISQALRPRPRERLSRADFSRLVARLQTLRNAL